MKKLYFFLCFIGSAQAMRQDRNPEDYLEQAQERYEQTTQTGSYQESQQSQEPSESSEQTRLRKRELLNQVVALVPYRKDFFKCFAHEYEPDKAKLRDCAKACETLQERLEKSKVIKPCSSPERYNAKYNPDVRNRLDFELALLKKYLPDRFFNESLYLSKATPSVQEQWKKAMNGVIEERKKTMLEWPEQMREEYAILAMIVILNENRHNPIFLSDDGKGFVEPGDPFIMNDVKENPESI